MPLGKSWLCPAIQPLAMAKAEQCIQKAGPDQTPVSYWLWRFDRTNNPVPLDNFWNKTIEQSTSDLVAANNPAAGIPNGPTDVELAVDPYFPRTIPSVSEELRGKAVHPKGRNKLALDGHAEFVRDARLN
jgi:hypothetical protein